MIRACTLQDFDAIHEIINDGAAAYRGSIPADRLRDPYMSRSELQHEINHGVVFWGYEANGQLTGVMGTQDVADPENMHPVTLIRHAYVRTSSQGKGIGAHLLSHLRTMTTRPVLIGTWADATWAIGFYQSMTLRSSRTPKKNSFFGATGPCLTGRSKPQSYLRTQHGARCVRKSSWLLSRSRMRRRAAVRHSQRPLDRLEVHRADVVVLP